MYRNKLNIILYCLIFSLIFLITVFFGENVPYINNNITDYIVNLSDNPAKKGIQLHYDLSINLLIFISIYILIKRIYSDKIGGHLQNIWLIKSFISLFLIMIYENFFGLDQTQYFFFVINETNYAWHFGKLDKLIDINNPTINFLLPLKFINFIFTDSWFAQKNFQNILYFCTIVFFYKSVIILEPKLKNNLSIIYFISLTPSFLLFSSFITKDFIIIFFISVLFFLFISHENNKRKKISFFTIVLLLFLIFLLRWWVSFGISLVIMFIIFYNFTINRNFFKLNLFWLVFSVCLFCLYFIFYSNMLQEIGFDIYTKIFERIKVEHYYPPENYKTLFINVGEKHELFYLYPKALFKTIFNPFISQILDFKLIIFVLENVMIFTLLTLSFKNLYNKINGNTLFLILVVIILSHIYLPIGYLNSGTTLRYSLQIKYFLLIFVVTMNYNLFIYIDKFTTSLFATSYLKIKK